ncbi:MAG: FAD binding domain-containing protein [Chloroflexota bacterium]
MRPFDLLQPRTTAEAIGLLQSHGDDAQLVAGGAMLLILLQQGLVSPRVLVSVTDIPDLTGLTDQPGGLRIGAATTLREIERSPLITHRYPMLREALVQVANVRVRNVATLGGHLAHSDPHLDLPPVLVALGATVQLQSAIGRRDLPLSDFLIGHYENALELGEMIVSISIPEAPSGWHGTYLKYCSLTPTDWPTVGVAAMVRAEGDRIAEARVVAGSVAEQPLRLPEAEALLTNQRLSRALLDEVASLYAAAADPLADVRGSEAYKRKMTGVFVKRAILQAAQRAGIDEVGA